jgi:hypothetical protein
MAGGSSSRYGNEAGARTVPGIAIAEPYLEPDATSPCCGLSIASRSPMRRREIGAWVSASYWAFNRRLIS